MSDNEDFKDGKFTEDEYNRKPKKKNGGKIFVVILLLLVTNITTAFVASKYWIDLPVIGNAESGTMFKPSKEDIKEFSKLFVVKDSLEKNYYGEIEDNKLVEGAIKGMTSALGDPYTVYMNKDEFEKWNQDTEGVYVGLGIQVGVSDNKIVIISPFEDSPAAKAGILPGDVIEKINGEDMSGDQLEKAVGIMKGQKGEPVKLSLYREGKGNFDVEVKREEITMVTVKGEMLDKNIGYIRITSFDENTSANFDEKLNKLHSDGMKALVLDLRGNPGGLVKEAVNVASNFIPKGDEVVSTINKYDEKNVYKSVGGNYYDLPIVILTDQGTASASEILAGALRDYGKATIVGEKTFGKGIVQNIIYRGKDGFGDGTALKVTISSYFTPKGENIHKKGISPDIVVEIPQETLSQPYSRDKDPQYQKAIEVIKEKVK